MKRICPVSGCKTKLKPGFDTCFKHRDVVLGIDAPPTALTAPEGALALAAPDVEVNPYPRWLARRLAPLCAGQCEHDHGPFIDRYPEYATCNCPDCRKLYGVSETEWFTCEKCQVEYRGQNPRTCSQCSLPGGINRTVNPMIAAKQ